MRKIELQTLIQLTPRYKRGEGRSCYFKTEPSSKLYLFPSAMPFSFYAMQFKYIATTILSAAMSYLIIVILIYTAAM